MAEWWCGNLAVGWCGSVVVLLGGSELEKMCGSMVVVEVWKFSRWGSVVAALAVDYNKKVQHSTIFIKGGTVWYNEIQ